MTPTMQQELGNVNRAVKIGHPEGLHQFLGLFCELVMDITREGGDGFPMASTKALEPGFWASGGD